MAKNFQFTPQPEPDPMGEAMEGLDDSAVQEDSAVENVVQDLTGARRAPAMNIGDEAERRFSLGQYYRLILDHPVFGDDDSESAAVVTGEIQDFVRQRLAELLGIKSAPRTAAAEAQFTEEEAEALRLVAAKLIKKPGLLEARPAKPPAVRPVAQQAQPSRPSQPQVRPAQAPQRPQARSRGRARVQLPDNIIQEGNKFYRVENIEVDGKPKQLRMDVTPPNRPPPGAPQPMPPLSPEVANGMVAAKASQIAAGVDISRNTRKDQ